MYLETMAAFCDVVRARPAWQSGADGTPRTRPTVRPWFDGQPTAGESLEVVSARTSGTLDDQTFPIGHHVVNDWTFEAILRVALPGYAAEQVFERLRLLSADLDDLLFTPHPFGEPTRSTNWTVQRVRLVSTEGPLVFPLDSRGVGVELASTIAVRSTFRRHNQHT